MFNSASFMQRHIAFTVIRNFSNLHLKNTKTCNCDNLRTFAFFFFSISLKTALCMPVIPFPSERIFISATYCAKAGLRLPTATTKLANCPTTDAPDDIVVSLSESIPDRREPYRRVPLGRVHLDERLSTLFD